MARSQQMQIFEQVWQTVNNHFYDPQFNGVDWAALRQKYRPLISQAANANAAAEVINQMLAELKVSHTRFYTPEQLAITNSWVFFSPPGKIYLPPCKSAFLIAAMNIRALVPKPAS
jgi:carboxyl-terminal processing protease